MDSKGYEVAFGFAGGPIQADVNEAVYIPEPLSERKGGYVNDSEMRLSRLPASLGSPCHELGYRRQRRIVLLAEVPNGGHVCPT